jgi:DNA polymerase I-like protein with 3'-5' exonuclease and polymerase domains
MTCVRPNLQQLPREGGVRACITADPGYLLVSADFASVELRVAAALSGDVDLQQMLAAGEDIHQRVANAVWGAGATKADRYTAKRIVFGWLYGGGVPTLAAQAMVSESIVASAVDVLAMLMPGLVEWCRRLREMVRAGAVAMPTYAGRVIHLTRDYPHKAPNYAIQGTARELLVDAIERWEGTPWAGSVLLPVHDEVLAMVRADEAEAATAELVRCMTGELHGVSIVATPSVPSFAWQDSI